LSLTLLAIETQLKSQFEIIACTQTMLAPALFPSHIEFIVRPFLARIYQRPTIGAKRLIKEMCRE